MSSKSRVCVRGFVACLATATLFDSALAISPAEQREYDAFINQAANTCANYPGKSGALAIESLKIEIIRGLQGRRVLLCPDSKLSSDAPTVWYGNHRAMAWNPAVPGSTDKVRAVLDRMTRDDVYPNEIRVWDAGGKELENRVVPQFKVNCVGSTLRDCVTR
jgi:hypothetical protein